MKSHCGWDYPTHQKLKTRWTRAIIVSAVWNINVVEYHKKIWVSLNLQVLAPHHFRRREHYQSFVMPLCLGQDAIHKCPDCIDFTEVMNLFLYYVMIFHYNYVQSQSQDTPWNGNTMFRCWDGLRDSQRKTFEDREA